MASLKRGNKYGAINADGDMTVQPIYDYISPFYEGAAVVKLNNLYGLINTQGKVIVPIEYRNIYSFYDGLAVAVNSVQQYNYLLPDGSFLLDAFQLREPSYEDQIIGEKDGKYGCYNKDGSVAIPFEYTSLGTVGDYYRVSQNGKFGLIDKEGQIVVALNYENVFPPQYGLFNVIQGGKQGLLNASGEFVMEPLYDRIGLGVMGGEYKYFVVKNGLNGVLNLDGTPFIPIIYDTFLTTVDSERLTVVKDGLYGEYDWNGVLVTDLQYSKADYTKWKKSSAFAFDIPQWTQAPLAANTDIVRIPDNEKTALQLEQASTKYLINSGERYYNNTNFMNQLGTYMQVFDDDTIVGSFSRPFDPDLFDSIEQTRGPSTIYTYIRENSYKKNNPEQFAEDGMTISLTSDYTFIANTLIGIRVDEKSSRISLNDKGLPLGYMKFYPGRFEISVENTREDVIEAILPMLMHESYVETIASYMQAEAFNDKETRSQYILDRYLIEVDKSPGNHSSKMTSIMVQNLELIPNIHDEDGLLVDMRTRNTASNKLVSKLMGTHGQTDPYADGYNMLLGGSYVTYYLDGYGSGGTPQITLSVDGVEDMRLRFTKYNKAFEPIIADFYRAAFGNKAEVVAVYEQIFKDLDTVVGVTTLGNVYYNASQLSGRTVTLSAYEITYKDEISFMTIDVKSME